MHKRTDTDDFAGQRIQTAPTLTDLTLLVARTTPQQVFLLDGIEGLFKVERDGFDIEDECLHRWGYNKTKHSDLGRSANNYGLRRAGHFHFIHGSALLILNNPDFAYVRALPANRVFTDVAG